MPTAEGYHLSTLLLVYSSGGGGGVIQPEAGPGFYTTGPPGTYSEIYDTHPNDDDR